MKDDIKNGIKYFLLTFMMSCGFFTIYSFIWFAVGLPQTNWALLLMWVLACVTEWGYVEWVKRGDNNG